MCRAPDWSFPLHCGQGKEKWVSVEEGRMRKQTKAIADIAISILSNVAVVGIGLALFESRWGCLAIALLATIAAACIAWRANNHD
jgi:hypothetical protein